MKILNFLLLVVLLDVSAAGNTQSVTISKKNASLEDILKEIYKQTGFSYSAHETDLAQAPKITLNVRAVPIETVLDISLKNQALVYTIQSRIIVIKRKIQNLTIASNSDPGLIRGRVVSDEGIPVEARIAVKGSAGKKETITDNKGYFKIEGVNADDVLIIRGINFNTVELKIGNTTDLGEIVVAAKVTIGEEVVVANTGFEKVKPNEATGSYVVISKKILNEQFSRDILQRLNGVSSSVLFNIGKTDANGTVNPISIRGLSTINASTAPLIVLDDNIFTGNISSINPNDVENITILKDAAATSIYGVGGANGVIVITTKKGQFDKKVGVDASTIYNISQKSNLYSQNLLDTRQYIEVEELLYDNGYFNTITSIPYAKRTPLVELLLKRDAKLITAADFDNQVNALKNIDRRKEYNKYFNSNSITQQHSVSIDGGSKNVSWLFSGVFDRNVNSQDATDQRVNLHFGNSFKINSALIISLSGYYSSDKNSSGKPALSSLGTRNAPYLQYADEFGNPLPVVKDYNNSFLDTIGGGKLLDWKYYPLTDYLHDRSTSRSEQIIGNINIQYNLFKDLQITASYQYQKERVNTEHFADAESYYVRNLVNTFTNLQTTDLNLRNPVPVGGILTTGNQGTRSQNFRIQANANRRWGKHNLSGLVGVQLREAIGMPAISSTIYGYSTGPVQFTPVDYRNTNLYRDLITGTELTIPGMPYISSASVSRFVSLYGNMAYVYNGRYVLSASFRKDASNIFGLDANDRWNPLWSSGVSWDISKESFYPLGKIIPSLRLKVTLGYSGNLDNSKTALPVIKYSYNEILNRVSAFIAQPNNPQLRWEKSRQLNIGLNFSLPNHWMTGSVEYYQKMGIDLYGETPYDYTGFGQTTSITRNVANLRTTGIDVTTDFKLVQNRKFSWNLSLLYNYNVNVTTKYNSLVAQDGSQLLGADGNRILPVVGKPLYALVAYRWAGLDANGNPQGYLNGHPSTDYVAMLKYPTIYKEQVVYVGAASPPHFGAMANRFQWRGLSLSVNLLYKFGYYFLRPSLLEMSLINSGTGNKEYAQRWQKPGDELITNVPAFIYPSPPNMDMYARDNLYKSAEINVLKADNIRLQYFSIGYTLGQKAGNSVLKNLSLYGSISNLGLLWRANKEKIDPDYPNEATPPKSFSFGLRASL